MPVSKNDTPTPSGRSLHGLDWLNFFLADVRTGVGPFIAIYLTSNGWNPAQTGLALTAAEISGVITQAPGGALTDRVRSKRLLVGAGLVLLALSALLMAERPTLREVIGAQLVLGLTGSIFGPGLSAITLGLVGYSCLGARTGRNAAFGSAGNIVAAMLMGFIGYRFSPRAILYFVAMLCIPTFVSLLSIRGDEIDNERARGAVPRPGLNTPKGGIRSLFCRNFVIFAVMTILFHLGNGAMLAQMGETMSREREHQSSLWMAAIVTVPQVVMAIIAAPVGKIADSRGRKSILLFGFLFLPVRALLCAFTHQPLWLVAYQVLDGLAAGIFGIVGVLMIADLSRGSGNYNLALGVIGAAVGVGASISTAVAGFLTARMGFAAGYFFMAACGVAAFLTLWLMMPETRHPGPDMGAETGEHSDIGQFIAANSENL